jgi:hypothetical protein
MSFSRSLRSPMTGAGLQEELPPRIGAGVASGENTAIKTKAARRVELLRPRRTAFCECCQPGDGNAEFDRVPS